MYKSGETEGYADDINIMGRSMWTAGKLHRELEGHTETVGRTITTAKTNIMIQSRKDLSCKKNGNTKYCSSQLFYLPRNN
jgi:hypothetical protein